MALGSFPIDLHKRPPRREMALIGLVGLGLFYVFFIFLWQPRAAKFRILRDQSVALQKQLKAAEALVSAVEQQMTLQDQRQDAPPATSPSENRWQRFLEQGGDPASAVAMALSLLADRTSLGKARLLQTSVGDKESRKGYAVIPLSLELRGPYAALVHYVEALEKPDQPLLVSEFSFRSDTGGFLVAKITVELYLPE
ncbi:MAG: hypothetical protein HY465_05410 [Deltaproteobacteria bacterium]|nr:hypothetical protein [Deltaproteobacteria bacterium]